MFGLRIILLKNVYIMNLFSAISKNSMEKSHWLFVEGTRALLIHRSAPKIMSYLMLWDCWTGGRHSKEPLYIPFTASPPKYPVPSVWWTHAWASHDNNNNNNRAAVLNQSFHTARHQIMQICYAAWCHGQRRGLSVEVFSVGERSICWFL